MTLQEMVAEQPRRRCRLFCTHRGVSVKTNQRDVKDHLLAAKYEGHDVSVCGYAGAAMRVPRWGAAASTKCRLSGVRAMS